MGRRTAALAAAVALIGAGGAAGASYAAVRAIVSPGANGVISACYNTSTGAIRIVRAKATCASGESKLAWASNARPSVHVVGATGEPAYDFGWKQYDGSPPFANLSFYKDPSGVVHLTGLACRQSLNNPSVCNTAVLVGGTEPIFTLPVGFRPAYQLVFTTLSFGVGDYYHTRVDVKTDGTVELVSPPSDGEDWVSFDGISFLPS